MPYVYVVNEMGQSVSSFKQEADGVLQLVKTEKVGHTEGSKAAEIAMTPDGAFIFVTNRGVENTVSVFATKSDGSIEFKKSVAAVALGYWITRPALLRMLEAQLAADEEEPVPDENEDDAGDANSEEVEPGDVQHSFHEEEHVEHEVPEIKKKAAAGHYPIDSRLQSVFDAIKRGDFSCNETVAHGEFCELIDTLCNIKAAGTWDGDRYLVVYDFPSFIDAQNRVDKMYKDDKKKWWSLSIQAASSMAQFSTDRTMREYASVIWGVEPAPRPLAGMDQAA